VTKIIFLWLNPRRGLGVKDPLVIEQYYNAFDSNKDGKINFKEFAVGLSVVQRGTVDERLQCNN
jgi:hypothetical protein